MRDYWDLFIKLIGEQTRGIYLRDILLVSLVALLLLVLSKAVMLRRGTEVSRRQLLLTFWTVFYAGVLLLITIFRRESGSRSGNIEIRLNLGSLTGGWYRVKQAAYSILNVILFVPWGFLLRLKRGEDSFFKSVFMTALIGFLTSFTIECFQLVTKRGVFEITDLVTNVSGTVIGAVMASVALDIFSNKEKQEER